MHIILPKFFVQKIHENSKLSFCSLCVAKKLTVSAFIRWTTLFHFLEVCSRFIDLLVFIVVLKQFCKIGSMIGLRVLKWLTVLLCHPQPLAQLRTQYVIC